MATYYVRTDGSDSNAGTGPATNQAWQTITKAIGATGIAPGDTLYIAPGVYRGSFVSAFTSPSSEGQRITIAGNPTANQFTGVTPGPIIITNFTGPTTSSGTTFTCQTRSFITVQDISFVGFNTGDSPNYGVVTSFNGTYQIFRRCGFYSPTQSTAAYNYIFSVNNGNRGPTFNNCVFFGYTEVIQNGTGGAYNSQTLIRNSLFNNPNTSTNTNMCLRIDSGSSSQGFGGVTVVNCRFIGNTGIRPATTFRVNNTYPVVVQNCIFDTASGISSTVTGDFVESYNIFNCTTERTNVATGTGSLARAFVSPDFTMSRLSGWANLPFWSNHFSSASQNAGINTNSDTTDFYGVTWLAPSTPTMGPIEYFSNQAIGQYLPTERNASTITIAPGSTSQSIELYLGATGLTTSTSGLTARYNRTRTASVSIPLVARTIAQAWTAGGFAEVDATNMPGVYRLDLPDEALAAGADDVTVVVRGASDTNGAVMTVKLSSGGLTSAQTASAVWDEPYASHNTAGTFSVLNKETNQNTYNNLQELYLVPGLVWDEAKANHTIPNTFGDYLDTKVSTGADTSRIQLRQGPFLIKQNAIDSVITEVNQFLSTVPNIEMVLIDSSGGSVSVAGATLVMRVRNQAGTAVVNNVTPTVAYADGGVIRWSPNLSWTALGVTTAGTYRIVVERTMSGVTTTFGPFLVQLSSG